jgi:DNA-binding transcriptional regulator YhcF (GntR family)
MVLLITSTKLQAASCGVVAHVQIKMHMHNAALTEGERYEKEKTNVENVIQVAKNRGMTPEEFIKMLIDNYEEIGLSKKNLQNLQKLQGGQNEV